MKTRNRYLFTALAIFAFGLTSCGEEPVNDKYDNAAVKSVEFADEMTYAQLGIGDSVQLTPVITWREGVGDVKPEIVTEWRTSKSTVAKIEEDGLVTAVGSGKAYITYRAGFKMATCKIYVPSQNGGGETPVDPEIPEELNASSRTVGEGGSFVLNATPNQVPENVNWTSKDVEIATVTPDPDNVNNATIDAIKAGTVEIKVTVTAGNATASASCTVTVVENGGGGDPDEPLDGQDYEIYMFIDYNNVDENDTTGTKLLARFFWYGDRPLSESGKVPDVKNSMALDPAFPYFIGWSLHSIIDTKEDLWDLNKDVVGTTAYIYKLYGIWSDQPNMSVQEVRYEKE